ncbi:MAG: DUF433 domain-containing protein [Bacteroidota bacterium]|nr:DUF433 domain-containing protein [Bacteroidota bacterium]
MDYQINDHIEVRSGVMGGKPVIKGKRSEVETVVSHLLAGDTVNDILEAFPFITVEDIESCREFAIKMSGLHYSVIDLKNVP